VLEQLSLEQKISGLSWFRHKRQQKDYWQLYILILFDPNLENHENFEVYGDLAIEIWLKMKNYFLEKKY
jgi:hypothetical protein